LIEEIRANGFEPSTEDFSSSTGALEQVDVMCHVNGYRVTESKFRVPERCRQGLARTNHIPDRYQ